MDGHHPIPVGRVPAWLRRQTMGPAAVSVLNPHPLDPEITPFQVLDGILHGGPAEPREWTLDLKEVKKRLIDVLNPCPFENLIVSLLQLEYPEEIRVHTGAPGDGGIDGFGSDREGNTVGLLQAKLFSANPPAFNAKDGNGAVRRYVAVLLPQHPNWPDDGAEHLDLDVDRRHGSETSGTPAARPDDAGRRSAGRCGPRRTVTGLRRLWQRRKRCPRTEGTARISGQGFRRTPAPSRALPRSAEAVPRQPRTAFSRLRRSRSSGRPAPRRPCPTPEPRGASPGPPRAGPPRGSRSPPACRTRSNRSRRPASG